MIWLNGWVFVYKISYCGFESSCSHSKLHIYKRMKFISIKENGEYECVADVCLELACLICEFLCLKLPWSIWEKVRN